jgi:hypothetical protein
MRVPAVWLSLVALGLSLPSRSRAQIARDTSADWLLSGGSEGERYLRTLQVAGLAAMTQWTIRPLSGTVVRQIVRGDSGQPWGTRFKVRPTSDGIHAIAPEAQVLVNSGRPYGFNDGAVWVGRGITSMASAGAQGRFGPLEFVVAPQMFWAQNAAFPLAPVEGATEGLAAFRDPVTGWIDLPQRFGDGSYARIDPGQSAIGLVLRGITVGASTANEVWGPAVESPFLLGNNAAGFAHLFAGTDGPLVIGPTQVGARIIAGRLEQSAYSPAAAAANRRYLTGVVLTGSIRWVPGLEIGIGRLFENVWPDSGLGLGDILLPLIKNPFKAHIASTAAGGTEPDNQLASVFARWAFPASGVEVYGELGREDNSADARDLLLEPDHDLAFMVGFQRVWRRADSTMTVVRGELLNTSISHLDQVRHQSPAYIHSFVLQGHTQRGQVLGAPAGYAGGSTSVAVDWFTQQGRTTVMWRRAMREPMLTTTSPRDVTHALSVDRMLFRPRLDLAPELTLIYNANPGGQGRALSARLGVMGRAHW